MTTKFSRKSLAFAIAGLLVQWGSLIGYGVAGCLRVLAGYWIWGEGKTFGGLRPKKGQVNKWIDTAT
jgi:hypothetical protein